MDGSPIVASNRTTSLHSSGTIDFSEGCLIVAIALAVFWVVDPFTLQLWRSSVTRHIPAAFVVGAVFLNAAGRLLFRPKALQELGGAFRTYFGLTLFAIFVVIGSLFARFVLGIESTFLPMGALLILGGPVNLWIIGTSNAPLALIRSITIIFVGISLLAVAANVVHTDVLVFHSLEHVVIASVAFPLLFGKKLAIRAGGAVLVVLATVAPNKLTGYIVMLMIFAWVYADELLLWAARDQDRVRGGLRICLGALAALLVAMAVLAVYQSTKSLLPDGNTVFRAHNYEMAFNRFLDSWIWGRAFAASSTDYFDVFVVNTTTQYLPTHSDPLDVLANGGLLAGIPFALGMLSIIFSGWKALRGDSPQGGSDCAALRPQLAMYFLIVVSGIPVMAFNPVLNHATLPYVYWTASAVMYALVAIQSANKEKSVLSGAALHRGTKG